MAQHRRKPLWRWEPAPYLVLVVLLLATGTVQPNLLPDVYWPLFGVTVAFAAFFVWLVLIHRRGRGADPSGTLRSLAGVTVLPVGEAVGAAGTPLVAVTDCRRHQFDIDSALAHSRGDIRAVLVPDATRWLALRLRVAVQLIAGERCYLAGFLPEASDERYHDLLHELAARGLYVSVPARVGGTARRPIVDLRLQELSAALDAATSPPDPPQPPPPPALPPNHPSPIR